MNGAKEYADFPIAGQHGRLFIVQSRHARGYTLRVFVLPRGEAAKLNHGSTEHAPLNADAVEVYGVVSGNPGWTECYGWLHEGPWQADFATIVERARAEKAAREQVARLRVTDRNEAERLRIKSLLATYCPPPPAPLTVGATVPQSTPRPDTLPADAEGELRDLARDLPDEHAARLLAIVARYSGIRPLRAGDR